MTTFIKKIFVPSHNCDFNLCKKKIMSILNIYFVIFGCYSDLI